MIPIRSISLGASQRMKDRLRLSVATAKSQPCGSVRATDKYSKPEIKPFSATPKIVLVVSGLGKP